MAHVISGVGWKFGKDLASSRTTVPQAGELVATDAAGFTLTHIKDFRCDELICCACSMMGARHGCNPIPALHHLTSLT